MEAESAVLSSREKDAVTRAEGLEQELRDLGSKVSTIYHLSRRCMQSTYTSTEKLLYIVLSTFACSTTAVVATSASCNLHVCSAFFGYLFMSIDR